MKMATATTSPASNRPLTAFEVYQKGLAPNAAQLQMISGGNVQKKKKTLKEKKLKKAALLAAKTSTPKGKKGRANNDKSASITSLNNENSNAPGKVADGEEGKKNVRNGNETKIANEGLMTSTLNEKKEKKNKKSMNNVNKGSEKKIRRRKPKIPEPVDRKKVRAKNRKTNVLKDKIKKVKELVNIEIKNQQRSVPNLVELDPNADVEQESDISEEDSDEIVSDEGLDISEIGEEVESEESGEEVESEESTEEEAIESDDQSEEGARTVSFTAYMGKDIKAVNCKDSMKEGEETFTWIIHPHQEKTFFEKFWEKKPLLIKRKKKDYYKGLFSTQDFDRILHEEVVMFSKNLDITSYTNGKRETHNPIGRAHAPVVWDYYNNGCSLRMLNPQTFHPRVWKCLSSLQEYFNSFCGANVYLTPPDTQGFAPHWDDIEAFILQLEGKKRWRVYAPRTDDETLPENSSPNLDQKSIGKPILDTVLEPGDLLYFPRGYIHQGHAAENEHSLHITLSTYQKNSWGHYLEKFLPHALSLAMAEDVEFRRGLPRDYLQYMGIVHMEMESEHRTAFKKKVCDLVMRMVDNGPYDVAVDQRGASFLHDCLPPYLMNEDKQCSVYGSGEKWCNKKMKVVNRAELQPDTPIRLIRGNCIRMVVVEENVQIYHCLENSREYHQEEPQYLEVPMESAPGIEALILSYPAYIAIESLPLEDEGEKMILASGLWERGLLATAHPLEATYDD